MVLGNICCCLSFSLLWGFLEGSFIHSSTVSLKSKELKDVNIVSSSALFIYIYIFKKRLLSLVLMHELSKNIQLHQNISALHAHSQKKKKKKSDGSFSSINRRRVHYD